MNRKSSVLLSFFIALAFHLILFNVCTIVFPIDSSAPKPKFFFLGSILKQSDVRQIPSSSNQDTSYTVSKNFEATQDDLKNLYHQPTDQTKNPFAIETIGKPLLEQTTESQEKTLIKSTFDTSMEENTETETQPAKTELKIKPYQPLQFHPR